MPESVYNILQSIREVIQRASAEGLMPFILAGTQGTPAKRNTVRILEIAVPILIVIFTISYYGGKFVRTVELMDKDLAKRQIVDEKMLKTLNRMDKLQGEQAIILNRAVGDIKNHINIKHSGGNIGG